MLRKRETITAVSNWMAINLEDGYFLETVHLSISLNWCVIAHKTFGSI